MDAKRSREARTWIALLAAAVLGGSALADAGDLARIAVLDFELNDLTLAPRTAQELERTASVKPLLQEALERRGGFEIVDVDPQEQARSDAAFGYLFEHPDVAAALGAASGADWIAVGRVHKPSFLFTYLKVRLVEVRTGRLAGDYVVEVKGPQKKLTERGTRALAEQIEQAVQAASRT